ncbi:protease pro-enzyme activation domain-containing protein, partial [Granulicella sp. L46]|uniref:protease pro-enzyme activation domain-containing protein n=1 Tax=Granulicella sp. L46 TaxID=1641865 RepID=UPI0020B16411
MHSRFAIRHRCTLLCALIAWVGGGVITSGLSAQAPSDVISRVQPVKQADRISTSADYGRLVALPQKLPAWVKEPNPTAEQPVDLAKLLHVSVLLSREAAAESAFSQLVANQQNPMSPLYHHWLTPQQVGELYGPTANDLAAVTSWLASQGLTV